MRATFRSALACFVLTLVAIQAAVAQMPFLGPSTKVSVLMQPEVKKDLKITKDQDKQINQLIGDMAKQSQGMPPSMDMSAMSNAMSSFNEMDTKALAILTPEQQTRITQLWIQYDGAVVLETKELIEALKLNDDQQAKIKQIWSDYQGTFMDKMRGGPGGYKALKGLRKTANENTLAILTPDQLKQFTDMQGKELKFHKREY